MNFDDLKSAALRNWRSQSRWRKQAKDDFAFMSGHQWTDTERAMMEESSRPPIVFNRVAVIISAASGSEINNRTEVRFIPREIGDAKPNEILSAGGAWFRDSAEAESTESEAFNDLLVCGMGWTNTTLDFEEDDDGDPQVERIEPWHMFWDACARQSGLKDSRMFGRVEILDKAEAKERFPGKRLEDIDANWLTGKEPEQPHNVYPDDQWRYADEMDDPGKDGDVTVVLVQYRERKTVVEVATPDGQITEMGEGQFDQISKALPVAPPHRRKTRYEWKQAILGANSILEETQPCRTRSTFVPMTGMWDVKDEMFYGLLRAMRDPQKFANKWLSQTLHILNTNAKGGVIAEPGAVEDVREFEESWAAADGITWVRDGSISAGRITEKPKAQMPAAYMGLTEFAISSIRDASGVNMELLGLRDQNQPGILEYQRKQAAMTTLAKYFDSLRTYRLRQGDVILFFLQEYIAPMGRLVRIVEEGQAQYVPLAVDPEVRKYDVIVDDAPQAPNEKEKTWSVIQAMMPLLQSAGLGWEDWATILEYAPLPTSLVEKIKAKAEGEKDPEAEAMQKQMQQMAMQQAAAELQKTQSEAIENQAEAQHEVAMAQKVGAEAQLAPLKTYAELTKPMPAPSIGGPSGIGPSQSQR